MPTGIPRKPSGARVAWYRPDHRSMGAFLKSDQMRNVTARVALAIAADARELSPSSNEDAIHMRDQFRVIRKSGYLKVERNWRVRVLVVNDDPAAAPNEFGGKRNKRHRMLGRAGARFGDFKPDTGPGGTP